ncbi:MAG: TlpA family protein disulfide reductase [Candidatus Limnocylindria bacterium]
MTAGTVLERRPRPDLRRLPMPYLVAGAVLPLILLALWVGVLLVRPGAASGAGIGTVAPEFALADLDGQPVRLADLRGRPVVVNFWASWCGPCVEEFPLLREAAAEHADDGLAIVGIVYEDRSEAARGFMDRMGASWPAAMDPGGRVADAYGVFGPPETFFIGRDGVVVDRQIGQFSAASLDEKLTAIIRGD